jgi:hypothetical protein
MRRRIVWICGLLLLGGLVGCGAAPDGSAAPPADEAVSMSPISDDAGAIVDAPDEDLTWEMATTAADGPSPPPESDSSYDAGFSLAAPSDAPASANEDWPMSAPRHAPYGARSTRSAPVEIADPVLAETVAAPGPTPVRPTESVAHVDEIVSRLDYGTVGFYTPTELPWGQTFVQEIVLSPRDTPQELRTAMSNPTAPAEFSRLQIAPRMEARLTGSGFEIEPLSEPLQAITSHRPTKWRFKLTPVKSGPQELHLSLLAHIDIDGRDAPLVVETQDAQIEVDITVPQRLAGLFQAHWKWLWAAVVVPALGYIWRRKTGRKPPEEPIRHAKAA